MAILNFQMAQFVEQLLTIIAFGIIKIINMNSKDFKVSIRFGISHFVTQSSPKKPFPDPVLTSTHVCTILNPFFKGV